MTQKSSLINIFILIEGYTVEEPLEKEILIFAVIPS